MQPLKKIKFLKNERTAILPIKKTPLGFRYAVTTHGRVISFLADPKVGRILRPANLSNYPGVTIYTNGTSRSRNVHRLVAEMFIKPPSKRHKFVIHLNFKKDDNHYKNLKWETLEGKFIHIKKDPNYVTGRGGNAKLTEAKVKEIKLLLQKGKLTLKQIGKRYHISDMQIHRIKTGENWSKIKI
jgi:hypothetical protein